MMQPFLWELDIVQYHQMSEMVLLKPNLILKITNTVCSTKLIYKYCMKFLNFLS